AAGAHAGAGAGRHPGGVVHRRDGATALGRVRGPEDRRRRVRGRQGTAGPSFDHPVFRGLPPAGGPLLRPADPDGPDGPDDRGRGGGPPGNLATSLAQGGASDRGEVAMNLNEFWFVLVGVLLTGYAVLDGFDLGTGPLLLGARSDRERRVFLNAIGPVWNGNEVWLVT